jgi:hypothetical protein
MSRSGKIEQNNNKTNKNNSNNNNSINNNSEKNNYRFRKESIKTLRPEFSSSEESQIITDSDTDSESIDSNDTNYWNNTSASSSESTQQLNVPKFEINGVSAENTDSSELENSGRRVFIDSLRKR